MLTDKTKGAWLIHHTHKLNGVQHVVDFEDVHVAGKCGILVSHISETEKTSTISSEKLSVIAKAAGISARLELPSIINILKEEKIINVSSNGDIAALGLTTSNVLTHTSRIFDELKPSNEQKAAIEISEYVSEKPISKEVLKEYISDTHKISGQKVEQLIQTSEEIGFIDSEELDKQSKLYFNGNLFKRNQLEKTNTVLATLKPEEVRKIAEFTEILDKTGCVPLAIANSKLGPTLVEKLQSIGMYDFNRVANSQEEAIFVTKPSAFSKFGNPFEEDIFDLAKAFVASLTYGMTRSTDGRGRITMLQALLRRLISGYEVGPATAIGEDYKVLELKRVVAIRHDSGSKFYMRLLKKEVGELALQVLNEGEATEQTVLSLRSGNVSSYIGPEANRSITRRKVNRESSKDIIDALRTLR